MSDEYVLAGDLGGTNLRIAAVNRSGNIVRQTILPTPKRHVIEEMTDAILHGAREVIETEVPLGFGLAMAALVDPRRGQILSSPNLPELDGQPLVEIISTELGVPVVLENDATAAAIGEHWLGSSKSVEHSVFVTLGTGVGGGLILDGRPFRGTDGTAGEIGHICVEPDGVACGCGSHGCVEQYASATAIIRIARELLTKGAESSLRSSSNLTAKSVYLAAINGDNLAKETFRIMGHSLGLALADLVNALNPGLVVIGGGVAAGWDAFIDHVRAEISSRAFRHPAQTVRLARASLGESAGVLGAARVIFDAIQ